MAEYPDLASLRSALTADDAETRSKAYGAVYENTDLAPSEVMNDDETIDALRAADVVETPEDVTPASEHRERMVQLLEQIAANTGGGS